MKNDDEIRAAVEAANQIAGSSLRAQVEDMPMIFTLDLEGAPSGTLVHLLSHLNVLSVIVPLQGQISPTEAERIAQIYGASSIPELMQKCAARCVEIQEELTFRIDGAPCGEPDCPHCGDGLGDDGPPSA